MPDSLQIPSAARLAPHEGIYEQLRRRIILFDLLPGETLSENSLAADLGVSRTPIRDALARLQDEGCIRVYPQRGTKVSHISLERVRQAVFLTKVLEQDALAALCAAGLSEAQIKQVSDSLARQRRLYDAQQFEDLLWEDCRLHAMSFEFCNQGLSWTAIRTIDCDLLRVQFLIIRTFSYKAQMAAVSSWESNMTEHRMILDALRKRDSDAVYLLSDNHLGQIMWKADNLRRIYPEYFASGAE